MIKVYTLVILFVTNTYLSVGVYQKLLFIFQWFQCFVSNDTYTSWVTNIHFVILTFFVLFDCSNFSSSQIFTKSESDSLTKENEMLRSIIKELEAENERVRNIFVDRGWNKAVVFLKSLLNCLSWRHLRILIRCNGVLETWASKCIERRNPSFT